MFQIIPIVCGLPWVSVAFQKTPFSTAAEQIQAGKVPDAVATLTAAIRANPKSGENAYLLLSDCQMRLQQPDEAVKTLRSGLRNYPAAPVLERTLGEILFHQKSDSSEAGTLFAHAAKLLTRDPEAKHYYAQWAYLNARDRVCAQQEREALALPGLNDLALLQMNTLLGMCESRLEESDAARQAFQRANQINFRQPNYDPVAAYQYVQFLTRYNDDASAQAIVDEILKRLPNFGPAHLEKARYLDRAKQPESAIAEAQLALRSDGNDQNSERAAHNLLAKCHFLLGHTDEAAQEQKWIADHPNPETPRN
jgi:predicted Zn-dependent protease